MGDALAPAEVNYAKVQAQAVPTEFKLTLNGKAVAGQATPSEVINPATGQVFAMCPSASTAQLDEACASAKAALPAWRDLGEEKRKEYLQKVKEALNDEVTRHQLAKLVCLEQGKALYNAMTEVDATQALIDAQCSFMLPPPETVYEDDASLVQVVMRPVGVVCAICPWNFPLLVCAMKVLPALHAGCTVVLKPSPYTPLATLLIGEVYNKILPPGVVNILSGGNDLGDAMTRHPVFSKVTFTGSVATGKKVQMVCAESLKRCTLELGGNDAAIVLPNTDPKSIADGIFGASMANSGQVCVAVKRVYVPEEQHDELVKELVNRAEAAKFGDGMTEGNDFGPLNNKMQFDKVTEYVEDAKKNGATIHTGGKQRGQGYIYEPTIISNVTEDFRIVKEEQFGPALPILKYGPNSPEHKSLDDVIAAANNTHYGLGSSVWGADNEKAQEVAAKMEAGTAWINQHLVPNFFAPFGGFKQSGIGREGGPNGILNFLEPQTMNTSKQHTTTSLLVGAAASKL